MNFNHIIDWTTKKIKAQTVKINDLFEMKMIISDFINKTADSITSDYASESATAEMWHHQMRHLDYDNLKHLVKIADEINLTNINLSNSSSYKLPKCKSCIQAFVKQKLFDQISQVTRKDEIIHVNLIYLIKSTDYDRFKDYVFITDNWNDSIAVYFIKNKSEAVKYLQKYCNYKKAHKMSVLMICSDNEFVIKNRKFIIWRKNKEIE